jgi:undecaprenyl-diphosphatase
MRLVTNLAGPPAVCLVVVAVAVTAWWLGRPRPALFMISATAGAGLLVWVAKHLVGRSRPGSAERLVGVTGAAFPSGHAAQSVACWVSLAVVVAWVIRNRFVTVGAPLLALAIALVVGGSRVYLGVHWPSDVIAGWSLGLAWVGSLLAAFAIWSALADRSGLRDPTESGRPARVPPARPPSGAGRLGEQ